MNSPAQSVPDQLVQLHQSYCRLTGQSLTLRFDRERLWFEFLRAGFTLADLIRVVRYLQSEISYSRRNVGALKLSNLLQPDRFEEDLQISRVRLRVTAPAQSAPAPPRALPAREQYQGRQRALQCLRQIKAALR
jgi:hypothetical protein